MPFKEYPPKEKDKAPKTGVFSDKTKPAVTTPTSSNENKDQKEQPKQDKHPFGRGCP